MSKRRGRDEGSIWQREDKWRCAAVIDGKRIYKTFNTKTECKDYLRSVLELGKKGWRPATSNLLFKDYLTEWVENKKTNLKPNTYISYTKAIKNYVIPLLGNYKLSELERPIIEAAYRKVTKALQTKKIIHSIVNNSLNDAVENNILYINPSNNIRIILAKREMKILDEQQLKLFLEVAKKDKYWLYFKLACVTGARINELLALEWEDMDFKKKMVRISKQVQHEVGVKDYTITTKSGKSRNIQLGDNTINDILEYRELTQSSSGLIFKRISGEFVNQCSIRNHFSRILNECSLPRIRIHDLRHTAASIMLNNNVPVTIVSEILGHSSINTTLTVYAHAIPNQQYKATEIMDNF